jgi:hypothetical protein
MVSETPPVPNADKVPTTAPVLASKIVSPIDVVNKNAGG